MTPKARRIRTTRRARKIREGLYLGMWAASRRWSVLELIDEFHLRKFNKLQREASKHGYYSAR